jgi:hypothetical protein
VNRFSATLALITSALFLAAPAIIVAGARTGPSADPPVAKVKVHQGGGVSLDGQSVTLDQLRERMKKHKEMEGVVWCYRTSDDPKARETGEAVIKIIIDLQLPVRLMEKDDE